MNSAALGSVAGESARSERPRDGRLMPWRSFSLGAYLPETALEYYLRWLKDQERSHDARAVREFVQAHPFMFGASVDVTVRGYVRRIAREPDSSETFARHIATRYERWRAARMAARSTGRLPRPPAPQSRPS